jgi:hypothetical protein
MAIIALMEHELVRKRRVIEPDEFLHGVGLGQILGPFAVNTALFAGYRLYGTLGGLTAAIAFMAPSLVLVLILSWLYFSYRAIPALKGAVAGLGPVVIALILSAAWSMGRKAFRSWIAVLLGSPYISCCSARSRQSSEGFGYGRFVVAGLVSGDGRERFAGETLRHALYDWPCLFRGRIRPHTRSAPDPC